MSSNGFRLALAIAAFATSLSRAEASVQILMTIEGARGPIGASEPGTAAPSMKVRTVQLDLVPSVTGPLLGPKPVVVTRPMDDLSGALADEVASNDRLQVTIMTFRSSFVSGMPQRRVIRLFGARILSIHAGMDATTTDRNELGTETVVFTYERIEVEDDGVRVFTSGG